MVTKTKGLSIPKSSFQKQALSVVTVEPNRLIRVSTHHTGEPYFGQSGANRFDDPNPIHVARYGTCYFGYNLKTAIAETLLHDISPVNGHFLINPDRIAARFVIHYRGSPLTLANLTGVFLKRAGLHAGLSGTSYYKTPQRWSKAIHDHPDQVDGLIYMSHHLNTEKAVVLFDRASSKIQLDTATPLPSYPGFAKAAKALGIRSA